MNLLNSFSKFQTLINFIHIPYMNEVNDQRRDQLDDRVNT